MVKERMSGTAGVGGVARAHPDTVGPVRHTAASADRPANPAAGTVPPSTGPIPVEEAPLDPRAIARASLDAARNVSLWWTSTGIVVATVVALAVGTRAGAFVLAGVVLVCAVVRAVLPSPGPVALAVRAKSLDVAVLVLLGSGVGVLAQILPH
jgi:hypothetical protein